MGGRDPPRLQTPRRPTGLRLTQPEAPDDELAPRPGQVLPTNAQAAHPGLDRTATDRPADRTTSPVTPQWHPDHASHTTRDESRLVALELATTEERVLITRNSRDFAPLAREWAEASRHHPHATTRA